MDCGVLGSENEGVRLYQRFSNLFVVQHSTLYSNRFFKKEEVEGKKLLLLNLERRQLNTDGLKDLLKAGTANVQGYSSLLPFTCLPTPTDGILPTMQHRADPTECYKVIVKHWNCYSVLAEEKKDEN